MSVTVNSKPGAITNEAKWSVSTNVAQDSSHQNVRIRAELYIDGEIECILEQPKGLGQFDFSDILDKYAGLPNEDHYSGDKVAQPSVTEIGTSWTEEGAVLNTFNSSGVTISEMRYTGSSEWKIRSNQLSLVEGDIVIVAIMGRSSGTPNFTVALDGATGYTNHKEVKPAYTNDHATAWFQVTDYDPTQYIFITNNDDVDFEGEIRIYKMSKGAGNQLGDSDENTRPVVFARVHFVEVYENADNSTILGVDPERAETVAFVPWKLGPYTSNEFDRDFICNGSADLAMNYGAYLADGGDEDCGLYAMTGGGMWLPFASLRAKVALRHGLDGVGKTTYGVIKYLPVLYVNVNQRAFTGLESASSFDVYIQDNLTAQQISREYNIPIINSGGKCSRDPVLLEFIGPWGPCTVALLDGLEKERRVKRLRSRNRYGVGKVLDSKQLSRWSLKSSNRSEEYRELLAQLVNTEYEVRMMNGERWNYSGLSYILPVSVLNEDLDFYRGRDVITNEIQIEFYTYENERS